MRACVGIYMRRRVLAFAGKNCRMSKKGVLSSRHSKITMKPSCRFFHSNVHSTLVCRPTFLFALLLCQIRKLQHILSCNHNMLKVLVQVRVSCQYARQIVCVPNRVAHIPLCLHRFKGTTVWKVAKLASLKEETTCEALRIVSIRRWACVTTAKRNGSTWPSDLASTSGSP